MRSKMISFIVPTLNRPESLKRCVLSLMNSAQGTPADQFEVVVAFDRRDERSKEIVRDGGVSGHIRYVEAADPGANAARNAGARAAQGHVLYFLDDDCVVVDQGWVKRVAERFVTHPRAWGIGGGYRDVHPSGRKAAARNILSNCFVLRQCRPDGESAVLLGGNAGYRKDLFDRLGGFDASILYGSAETELNHRILLQNGSLLFFDDLSVGHCPSEMSLFVFIKKGFVQGRGMAYSWVKNGGSKEGPGRHCGRMVKLVHHRIRQNKGGAVLASWALVFLNAFVYRLGLVSFIVFSRYQGRKA